MRSRERQLDGLPTADKRCDSFVTVSSGSTRIQTDENGLAAGLSRCKLLISSGFPLELSTHNAGFGRGGPESTARGAMEQSSPKRKRMTEAPIKLPPGHTIPIRTNSEIAQLFDQEEITHLNDVYRGR